MDKEGTKFQNYAQIKEQAALHSRDVATVKQAWPPVGSGEPSSQSAAMWVSLDGYIRVKTVMRFDGNAFRPTALSEYTENADLKEALDWVESVGNSKGLNLRFLPDV